MDSAHASQNVTCLQFPLPSLSWRLRFEYVLNKNVKWQVYQDLFFFILVSFF